MSLLCDTVCGGGVWEGTMQLAQLLAGFQWLPPLPTRKLGPSGADSPVGESVYILEPCGYLQWTLLWGWDFLLLLQSPQVFSVRGFEALFHLSGTLGCSVCLAPQLFLLVYLHANVGWPLHQPPPHLSQSFSCWLAGSPLHLVAHLCPSYWSGWMFLQLLGCQTSMQFDCLSVLVVFCF